MLTTAATEEQRDIRVTFVAVLHVLTATWVPVFLLCVLSFSSYDLPAQISCHSESGLPKSGPYVSFWQAGIAGGTLSPMPKSEHIHMKIPATGWWGARNSRDPDTTWSLYLGALQ